MVIRYLLGAASEDETERLDELSVVDDDFAWRLSAAEDDLVDAYVTGELAGEHLERFRSHYLASAANRAKVEFARTLLHYSRGATPAGRPGAAPFSPAWLTARWGLAAAALLILAAGYLVIDGVRLRRDITDARAAQAALADRERQLQAQLNEQRAATADAAKELLRVRDALAELEGRSTATRPDRAGVLAFVLSPATRGAATVTTIAIPPGTGEVALRLPLEAGDFPRYRATLKDAATERVVWRSMSLRPTPATERPTVVITLSARVLEPRLYTLELSGVPARGDEELVGSYPFRVVLQ